MKKDIRDYLKIYHNFIDIEYCSEIIKKIEVLEWESHRYHDASENNYTKFENEFSVLNLEIEESKDLTKKIWNIIYQYVVKDMEETTEWWGGWQGYSPIRFNKYDVNTKMRLHCDHIHTVFDGTRRGIPILTVLGSLNNDYIGGELIMWDDEIINLPAGSIAVFPSNFMYPHEVRPIKSGTRYSYVSWVW